MTYMMEDSRTIPSADRVILRALSSVSVTVAGVSAKYIFYFVKGQDCRHVGGDELDKLLAGKDRKE